MATLTVRELETATMQRLERRARQRGRSVEAEAGEILSGAVGTRDPSASRDDQPSDGSADAEDLEDWIRGTWNHQG
jgi:plasmid stability protein